MITLESNQSILAVGVDLSINGIGFIATSVMHIQQSVRVDFDLVIVGKKEKEHVVAMARVVHVAPFTAGYRIGAQFTELDRSSNEAIIHFMGDYIHEYSSD